jgi:hypothetical protein
MNAIFKFVDRHGFVDRHSCFSLKLNGLIFLVIIGYIINTFLLFLFDVSSNIGIIDCCVWWDQILFIVHNLCTMFLIVMISDLCCCTGTLIPSGQEVSVFSFHGIDSKFIISFLKFGVLFCWMWHIFKQCFDHKK